MCIATPARVISIKEGRAKVDFSGNIMEVDARLVDVRAGDYVLVHAGCAIEVMKPQQARELADLLAELERLADDDR
ncbi:MAG: HypC/HybG/HupF family hydrogenase formation chaperone [Eubacteriales bacterium]|nr:HypC/HybG/HupF family hydrogenase formation chaperone [Eubacteriales bacterium]